MHPRAYPLHRTKLSPWQAYGLPAGIVAAASVLAVGAMASVWVARHESFGRSVVVAVVTIVVAVVLYAVGRLVSALRAGVGLVVLQPDRLEISDAASFEDTLILPRASILDITQPGVEGTGPAGLQRVGLGERSLLIGPEWPNIEIWLISPVTVLPPSAEVPIQATRLTLLTPGAAALLAWFRSELIDEPNGSWYRRIESRISPPDPVSGRWPGP
jgi:hypothetical protein